MKKSIGLFLGCILLFVIGCQKKEKNESAEDAASNDKVTVVVEEKGDNNQTTGMDNENTPTTVGVIEEMTSQGVGNEVGMGEKKN